MLIRNLVVAGVFAVLASQVPTVMTIVRENSAEPEPAVVIETTQSVGGSGVVNLKADSRGHFNTTIKINGKPVEGVIDTGASLIAIDESTARRLGIKQSNLDYKYQSQTANGLSSIAIVMLDRVELGGIRVRNVQAAVSRDGGLPTTLIGMSFLKKIRTFQVENGRLVLKQ